LAGCRAGWAAFHGPWFLVSFLSAGMVLAGQPGASGCSRVMAAVTSAVQGQQLGAHMHAEFGVPVIGVSCQSGGAGNSATTERLRLPRSPPLERGPREVQSGRQRSNVMPCRCRGAPRRSNLAAAELRNGPSGLLM
jgi:hypothetical protein